MRCCDKCAKRGDFKPGPVRATLGLEEFDLCESCRAELHEIISGETDGADDKKRGRPRKNA